MAERTLFRMSRVAYSYGETEALSDFTLDLVPGNFYGVVGPNGCGKTTLLDLMAGNKRPASGEILLDGRELSAYPRSELAKKLALVPQEFGITFPFTVFEIVLMGRHPHIPRFSPPRERDVRAVDDALHIMEMDRLRDKYVTELSGGEKQRVVLARALAQDTPVLLLDEPTSNLDINHALTALRVADRLVREEQRTVVAVMHDLNLAAAFCNSLIFMKNGKLHTSGPTATTLTGRGIGELFGVEADVSWSEYAGCSTVHFKKDKA